MYTLDLTTTGVKIPRVQYNMSQEFIDSMDLLKPIREAFEQMRESLITPLYEALESLREYIQNMFKQVAEAVQGILEPFRFLATIQPIYVLPVGTTQVTQPQNRYVSIDYDTYGFYRFDGQKITILHPSSSRCGRLLKSILLRKAEVVDYATIRSEMGPGDLDKTFKDLKKQLKQNSLELEYQRISKTGIAFLGIARL